jgi:hypothetical protein
VKVAPGTYDEPGGIDLKNYVDLEGSGQDTTTITCACGGATSPASQSGASATVRADGAGLHSELRQITVVNTGPNIYSTAIWTHSVAPGLLTLTGVTALASGGTGDYAIWNQDSSPTMRDIVATSTGDGTNSTESFAVTIAGGQYRYLSGYALDRVVATAVGASFTVGVRITGNVNAVRATGVDATVTGSDNANGLTVGFYLLNGRLSLNNGTSLVYQANSAANNWGTDLTGVSVLFATNSYLEGDTAAVNTESNALSAISRSTIFGATTGAGIYRCAFNVNEEGLVIGGRGC